MMMMSKEDLKQSPLLKKTEGRDSLSLHQILSSFSAPLKEEHAWALAYQFILALRALPSSIHSLLEEPYYIPNDCRHIYIRKDGHIHTNTFHNPLGYKREILSSKNKCLLELGLILFSALDFGLKDEEERSFSKELEDLFNLINSAEDTNEDDSHKCDDEGIERDEDDQRDEEERLFNELSGNILSVCASHLALGSGADVHYKAVIRALVSESYEITEFLTNITTKETETQEELQKLGLNDWARLWCQIMRDLRLGVKLKKINYSKTPIEYEMTPYEILMDDIRSKNYKLNKVPPPRTASLSLTAKRDAHEIILEFIRSRPPLKPASRRTLPPCRKESTPAELLMESIRNTDVRKSLRKTNGPKEPKNPLLMEDKDKKVPKAPVAANSQKKVIKVDESLKSEILNFEDDDSKSNKANNRRSMVENSLHLASIVKNNPCRRTQSFCGDQGPERRSRSRPRRKLFIDTHFRALTDTSPSPGTTSETESLPGSPVFDSGSFDYDDSLECNLSDSQMHPSLQSEFLNSEQWETALQTLHLSFEEVIHIRSVLTKAEMEGLPLDGTFKEDIEKGRVCFLCMRTRFGIFTWSHKCQMCLQTVCNKCSSKMNIPLERFSYSSGSSAFSKRPCKNAKASSSDEEYEFSNKSSSSSSSKSLTSSIMRANQLKKHSKLLICTDCREMIHQVSRTQKTARKVEKSKSFHLNFSSNYSGKEELY